jgi:hypothetical protein
VANGKTQSASDLPALAREQTFGMTRFFAYCDRNPAEFACLGLLSDNLTNWLIK